MLTIKATIQPLSAFGTLLKGDTLFGQICWALRNRFGEGRLREVLRGYTTGDPFAVVSDAFPAGYLPRPALPSHCFDTVAETDRKDVKKRVWLPVDKFVEPVERWLQSFQPDRALRGGVPRERPQPHNSIDRRGGTTNESFAPYAMSQYWYGQDDDEVKADVLLDIYTVLDETRLDYKELSELLMAVGEFGFGRDASIGLGKLRLKEFAQATLPVQPQANSWLTLAPCAPNGSELDAACSFYQVFTRFGRHGDIAVHQGQPFKTPVLLTQTAAVLTPRDYAEKRFVGQGLGGDGSLSKAVPETVHQGYAPVVGLRLPAREAS